MREIDKEEEKQHAALRKRQNDVSRGYVRTYVRTYVGRYVINETPKLIRAEINSEATKSIIRAEIDGGSKLDVATRR